MKKNHGGLKLITVLGVCLLGLNLWAESSNIPQRIISLGPSVTEALYLLKAEKRLVGNTVYCNRPEAAIKKEKIGNISKANLEKIVALQPDLVAAIGLTDPKTIKKLKQLGIRVEIFKQPKNFEALCNQFADLGKLVGKEKEAQEIITRVNKQVAEIKAQVANQSKPSVKATVKPSVKATVKPLGETTVKPLVLFQIGAKPLFVVTKQSFVHDFILFAGGENIASDGGIGSFSREEVLKRNPDVIIISQMGIVGEQEKKTWETFSLLSAVKHKRIHIVNSYSYCSPTPSGFVDSLRTIVHFLHPNIQLPPKESK